MPQPFAANDGPQTGSGSSGLDSSALAEDERRELERLRHEVASLRAAPSARRRRIRWASFAAAVLLVLGCVGVPASVLAVWTHDQVTDTDRFVETVSPVIEDPWVQSALVTRITQEVLTYVDVQQIANEAVDALAAQGMRPQLADRLRDLTGPLVRAQTAYRTLDVVAATWLPWITLLLLAAGVYLARLRRHALVGVGLVVAGMFVLAAALMVGRALLVSGVPEQGAAAAAATYDILVRFLRTALRTLAVVGLILALGAYLAGPAAGAVQVRAALGRAGTGLRRGRIAEALGAGPVGPWVHAHVRLLRGVALGLAMLVFMLLDRPTGMNVLVLALGLVLVLAVIEFLDHASVAGPPAGTTATGISA